MVPNMEKVFLIPYGIGVAQCLPLTLEDGRTAIVATEEKTLGFLLGQTALRDEHLRTRIAQMWILMDRYKELWNCRMSIKEKIEKANSLVLSISLSGAHLLKLSKGTRSFLDYAQARMLRRILKIPAAYASRIPHSTVRERGGTERATTMMFRNGMRLLGNILRLNDLAPEHLAVFNPRKADTPLHQSLTVRTLPKDVSKKQRG